ncbi:hypothetical protein VDS34_12990 [Xanthomonas campestris pv. campestris]|uniref:hypothetical protein n=1 Tax=Xanthomonas sp. Leaf148 TaxID=1736275 RepID=UPI0012E2BE2A|nr:hypothetical protein [Xanthomonas sp. Leaf148]MEB2124162.1 hypothetical protein [Xanthomonas campestris pv. campestris]
MKIKMPSYGKISDKTIPEIGDSGSSELEYGELPDQIGDLEDPELAPTIPAPIAPDPKLSSNTSLESQGKSTATIPARATGTWSSRRYYLVPPVGIFCAPEHVELQMASRWAAYEIPGGQLIAHFATEGEATVYLEEQGYRRGE